MVEIEERELLLHSLKGYLEELRESGVEELGFAELPFSEDCQGVGNPLARLLLVMSGAGFAGAAGELLAKIIQAMGFATSDVFLLSFNAGSGGAGSPAREAVLARIAAVGPEVVVTLGEPAAQLLLQSRQPVEKLRGRFHDLEGIPLLPTLHPDAMLENPALKREVWSDMQQVMRRLAQPA
ncbi:MAG: hypothetical protein A2075_10650 [Geobacteraceae bacterium GWC2_58_44]|nr:MAG: hypothetical protein A2075_10650 [Geobacteraceae bacterium GWC2_58_44]HBG07761.1 uracil-DNA glycosylase [Geobacter sp.]